MRLARVVGSELSELCRVYGVPGCAIGRIADGGVESVIYAGVETWGGAAVGEHTVFDAASLTKPVFAASVLRLVEMRKLDLDRPLVDHIDDLGVEDERASLLTPRLVLRHASGLPNWRPGRWTSTPCPLSFVGEPGVGFGYSGEGFELLRAAVEAVTGEDVAAVVRRLVLDPLDMTHSAMTVAGLRAGRRADGHDEHGVRVDRPDLQDANAAGSLRTTAMDYARFLASLHAGDLFHDVRTASTLMTPVTAISADLGWGCGIGTFHADGRRFVWQWGDDPGWKAFAIVDHTDGLVVFTNSDHGKRLISAVVLDAYRYAKPILDHIGWSTNTT